ncbi:DUF4198 domain-containing protein [Simiduia curdlanivorans]|uniref:DUF4198 domain-containing protein n=1 Tax=Simiduia curdlanivorans TaxID=1492769 RepID=A0ABV8V4R0_9GAMM|nr:DUF4198 domain-containing protein [Simiduia curdlanivorans]MDN3637330.1 DUF4198 domain-containing protein [Simiduia curdlanivorans]
MRALLSNRSKNALKVLVSIALCCAVGSAQAHKRWLLPTDFSLSDAEWVSVDYTASNNVFYVDKGMPLDDISVLSPSGKAEALGNPIQSKRRSSFEVHIKEQGSYRIMSGGEPMYFVAYTVPGSKEVKRARGPRDKLARELPEDAKDVKYMASVSRIETYVTLGQPSIVKPEQPEPGISLQIIDHPNALYADEPARFQFLMDGKPAKNLTLTLLPEGTRYRDQQAEKTYTTDGDGKVSVEWQGAGRYLLEAGVETASSDKTIAKVMYSYYLTLDVLKP